MQINTWNFAKLEREFLKHKKAKHFYSQNLLDYPDEHILQQIKEEVLSRYYKQKNKMRDIEKVKAIVTEANALSVIQNIVANYYQMPLEVMITKYPSSSIEHRPQRLARRIAMYLCRKCTDRSLSSIARAFNLLDHSSIHYACEKLPKEAQENRKLNHEINEILEEIKERNIK